MRRWRSPFSSLTILAMLFWLGTAMAPSVSSSGGTPATPTNTKAVSMTSTTLAEAEGPLLPWPADYCGGPCPEPFIEPSPESDDWRPPVDLAMTTIETTTTTVAAPRGTESAGSRPGPGPPARWRNGGRWFQPISRPRTSIWPSESSAARAGETRTPRIHDQGRPVCSSTYRDTGMPGWRAPECPGPPYSTPSPTSPPRRTWPTPTGGATGPPALVAGNSPKGPKSWFLGVCGYSLIW